MPINLNLTDQAIVIKSINNLNRLYSLDGIWTTYLENTFPPIVEENTRELEKIVEEMIFLLQQCRNTAESVAEIFRNYRENIVQEFDILTQNYRLTEEDRERLISTVKRHGGILGFAEGGIYGIIQNADSEIEQLQSKIRIIRNGEFSTGDLSKEFICNIVAGTLVGAIFAPFPTNLIGLGITTAILWKMNRDEQEC